ncbi:hypothetical protein CBP33_06010 [Acidovorax carolinensis]|nr:hypothetical protein CBP33_06010 [Acidovorax carolinensis]
MLIGIVLVAISLFFPPAWLALVAYIAYLVVTKKSRRDKIIMHEIRRSISEGRGDTIIKALYYEAAKSFAAENGALMSPYKNDPEDDCLIVDLTVDGSEYEVCFQRWDAGGTLLTVSPQ